MIKLSDLVRSFKSNETLTSLYLSDNKIDTIDGRELLITGGDQIRINTDKGLIIQDGYEGIPNAVLTVINSAGEARWQINPTNLQSAYEATNIINTSSTFGDLVISGTEQVVIDAYGGLSISQGVLETDAFQLSGPANAISILPTNVPTFSNNYISQQIAPGNKQYGQSFSPNLLGTLSSIMISVASRTIGQNGSVTLHVYEGSVSNLPVAISDEVLISSLTIEASGQPADTFDTLFTFSGVNQALLTPGTLYFVFIVPTSGSDSVEIPWFNQDALVGEFARFQYGNLSVPSTIQLSTQDIRLSVTVIASVNLPHFRMRAINDNVVEILTDPFTDSYQLTMPSQQGVEGSILSNDGYGNLTWELFSRQASSTEETIITPISWNEGNPPSSLQYASYRFVQNGNKVDLWFKASYLTPNSSPSTGVNFELPSNCPAPLLWGTNSADQIITHGEGRVFEIDNGFDITNQDQTSEVSLHHNSGTFTISITTFKRVVNSYGSHSQQPLNPIGFVGHISYFTSQ